jgi:hypothetical protein
MSRDFGLRQQAEIQRSSRLAAHDPERAFSQVKRLISPSLKAIQDNRSATSLASVGHWAWTGVLQPRLIRGTLISNFAV